MSKRPSTKGQGSQLSINDGFEMRGRDRPQSASSRKAWLDNDGAGSDDIDFGPRQSDHGAFDLPTTMITEPYGGGQSQYTQNVRADRGDANGIQSKVQRAIRSKCCHFFLLFLPLLAKNQLKVLWASPEFFYNVYIVRYCIDISQKETPSMRYFWRFLVLNIF